MAAQGGWFYEESFVTASSASLASSFGAFVAPSTGIFNGRLGIALCVTSTAGIGSALGVLQDAPAAGRAGAVRLQGICKLLATTSGSISAGAFLTCSTAGNAMAADTVGQLVMARALVGSTGLAAGTLIDALLVGPFPFTT